MYTSTKMTNPVQFSGRVERHTKEPLPTEINLFKAIHSVEKLNITHNT